MNAMLLSPPLPYLSSRPPQVEQISYCSCAGGHPTAAVNRGADSSWVPFIERRHVVVWRQRHPEHEHLYSYKGNHTDRIEYLYSYKGNHTDRIEYLYSYKGNHTDRIEYLFLYKGNHTDGLTRMGGNQRWQKVANDI